MRPPTHRRPLAWSQSIFMTKRWEKVLIMERCRESTSLLLLGVGGRDARVWNVTQDYHNKMLADVAKKMRVLRNY